MYNDVMQYIALILAWIQAYRWSKGQFYTCFMFFFKLMND